MGFGDEIIAAGRAEKRARELGRPVRIVDRLGETRWSELWNGNPAITQNPSAPAIQDGPGCRAYIAYPFTAAGHGYTDFQARDHRGHLYLTEKELERGREVAARGPFVVVEPWIKDGANANKRWPLDRWIELVSLLDGVRLVQLGPPTTRGLRDVEFVPTASFRDAAGVLAAARALVAPEGGLHHAAAALGVPAVVIFGGSPSVRATGYPEHLNLGGTDPCGRWMPCEHCAAAMRAIKPTTVAAALRRLIS
jgi:ADP-heptose:LPS heptosyltransferase